MICLSACLSNYISSSQSDVINHPFPDFNSVGTRERMSNYIPLFRVDTITYPCRSPDAGFPSHVNKRVIGSWLCNYLGLNHPDDIWFRCYDIYHCSPQEMSTRFTLFSALLRYSAGVYSPQIHLEHWSSRKKISADDDDDDGIDNDAYFIAYTYEKRGNFWQRGMVCYGLRWIPGIFLIRNRTMSQIPECTCFISHNAPFRTDMCTFLFWMEHCGIWN